MIVDNLIIIKGGAYNEIKNALKQWVDHYEESLKDGFTFQLFRNGRGYHIIQADGRLDNEKFFFLVNYMCYPEDIDYNINIVGFTTGKDDNKLKDQHLQVYTPSDDDEFDNVYISTPENHYYKVDFGGKIVELDEGRSFYLPTGLTFESPEIISVSKKEAERKKEENQDKSCYKRFRTISFIALGLLITSPAFYSTESNFADYTGIIGGLIAVWFLMDYPLLQSDRHYIYCLLMSLGFWGYTSFLEQRLICDTTAISIGGIAPLLLLLVQKPTRLIYKALLHREPIIDRPPPTFWDGVYFFVLLLALLALPFIVEVFAN